MFQALYRPSEYQKAATVTRYRYLPAGLMLDTTVAVRDVQNGNRLSDISPVNCRRPWTDYHHRNFRLEAVLSSERRLITLKLYRVYNKKIITEEWYAILSVKLAT